MKLGLYLLVVLLFAAPRLVLAADSSSTAKSANKNETPLIDKTALSQPTERAPVPVPALQKHAIGLVFGVDLAFVVALLMVRHALVKDNSWSLAGALSESTEWGAPFGSTQPVPRHEGSASRLIAFMGMLAILFFFVGFADWALWQACMNGKMPDMDNVVKFLAGGLALFVPYLVNQVRSALTPAKT